MCVIQLGIVILLSYAPKELDKMTLAKTYYGNLTKTQSLEVCLESTTVVERLLLVLTMGTVIMLTMSPRISTLVAEGTFTPAILFIKPKSY